MNYKLTNTNLHNPGKIPQIKDVVRFGRRGQKAGDSLSVDLSNGTDHNLKGKVGRVNASGTIVRSNITFTSNGKPEFVPRDQVSPLLVVYCSLFLHIISSFTQLFLYQNCFAPFLSAHFLF